MPLKFIHQSSFSEVGEGQSLQERMIAAGETCGKRVRKELPRIIEKAGVGTDYGKAKIWQDLDHTCGRELPDLMIPNIHWQGILEGMRGSYGKPMQMGYLGFTPEQIEHQERLNAVRYEFNKMLAEVQESDLIRCDEHWGFEGEEPPARGDQAARIASQIWGIFDEDKRKFLEEMGDDKRFREQFNCKNAVKGAMASFDICMRSKVPELEWE